MDNDEKLLKDLDDVEKAKNFIKTLILGHPEFEIKVWASALLILLTEININIKVSYNDFCMILDKVKDISKEDFEKENNLISEKDLGL